MTATWSLTLRVPQQHAEAAQARLMALGAGAVQELADTGSEVELRVWAASAEPLRALEAALVELCSASELRPEPDDWRTAWTLGVPPSELCPGWWIRYRGGGEVPAGVELLELEPALAFGDGSHPTTRLCAARLVEKIATKKIGRVLDVGSGSGVLSLLAVRLGATQLLGVDIEPEAVAAARASARLHPLSASALETGALGFECSPLETVSAGWDLVLANLETPTLLELAPELARVSRGAACVASGMLAPAHEPVLAALRARGGRLSWQRQDPESGWVAAELAFPEEPRSPRRAPPPRVI